MEAVLPRLTVMATRLPTAAAQAPARIATFDSTALLTTGARSVATLLRERAALHVRRYGPGGLASVSMRGTGAAQTLVLLDGHRIVDPQLGQLDWTLLPTVLLQQAEVLHGPASALYGSSGIGGAVNLQTVAPQPAFRLKTQLHAGAFGARGGSGLITGRAGPLSTVAAVSYRQAAGDYSYRNEARFPPTRVERTNADRQFANAYVATAVTTGAHRIRVSGWWSQAERGIPAAVGGTSAARQWDESVRLWATDTWQRPWGTLDIGGLVQHKTLRYVDPAQNLATTGRTWLASVDVTARRPWGNRWRVAFGGDARGVTAQHPQLATAAREGHASLFASGSGRYGRLTVHPALRVDGYARPASNASAVAISPRLGLNWQVARAPLVALKAQVGRAFRMPTLNDRYWQPGGNPQLAPERSWNTDVGAYVRGGWYRMEVTAFANWRYNQIVWTPQPAGYWRPQNVQNVRALGLEASAELHWTPAASWSLRPRVAATYTNARDRSVRGRPGYNTRLPFLPVTTIKPSLTVQWHRWALDLSSRYIGARPTGDGTREPYLVTDAHLRWHTHIAQTRLGATLQLRNALNTQYTVADGHPMPPRHLRITVRLSL